MATTTRDLNTGKRTVTTTIIGEDPTVQVEVRTYHAPSRKQYTTSVTAFRVDGISRKTALTYRSDVPMSPIGHTSTPVARHSTKALEAAHREAYESIECQALTDDLYAWGIAFLAAVNL